MGQFFTLISPSIAAFMKTLNMTRIISLFPNVLPA